MTPEQRALAEAVAAQLGLSPAPGFDRQWGPVLSLPDGGRLYISAGRQHGQMHFSTSVPECLRPHRSYYRDGEAPKTSINVAESKSAKQIAADVRRRLLPEYEREAADCAANKTRSDEYNTRLTLALSKGSF